ncbi:protein PET117 homolog, mitochondrial isoform X2 [Periplaneta americana]
MSLVSKAAFATATVVSVGIISYVHYKQHLDRQRLHDGVIRDVERQQKRRTENLYLLQQQIDLAKQLRKREDAGGGS